MLRDLKSEKIIVEIRELVSNIDSAKNEMNIYCDLVKQMFLSNSCEN